MVAFIISFKIMGFCDKVQLMAKKAFLTARWEYLVMANYPIDPAVLQPYVPAGVELDFWQDQAYVSLVGFLFLDTRIRGWSIPWHRNFEEFNLRFYVRCPTADGWRRGVVFIREIVPRPAIAWVANALYREHYVALPMDHAIRQRVDGLHVGYRWKFRREWNHLQVVTDPEPVDLVPGSEEAFITEHFWGYSRIDAHRTFAYQVEHPPWRIFPVRTYDVQVDVAGLYGEAFTPFLTEMPQSVFVAEGSPVIVRERERLDT